MRASLPRPAHLNWLSDRLIPARPPFSLLLPAMPVALAVTLPHAYLLIRAFRARPEAWTQLLRPQMLEVAARSLILVGTVTVAAVLLALPLAWLTARTDLPGRRLWSVLVVLPLVIPSYVGAYAFVAALGPRGMLQRLLAASFGSGHLPDLSGFPGAFLVLTLFTYPYVVLNVRAALRDMDPALEDAARSLGDTPLQAFLHVTLSHLRPAIAAGGLLVALYVLSDFGAVSMLRYTTFTRAIYVQYVASFDRSVAALLSLVLVIVTLAILLVEARVQRRLTLISRPRPARRLRPVRLGVWRWPALAFCALVVLLSLGVPLLVSGYWLIVSVGVGDTGSSLLAPVWHSVLASGSAALVALLFALPVALLATRYPRGIGRLIERASYAGYALPGIVVALSLVFFGANFAPLLYQTLAMLVFAYLVRFLPQATGTLRATLLQISPRLEEAARGLGRSTPEVILTITLPLMRSGLFAGGALVFLTSMKELPATLLLAPIEYDTLATRVWSATTEGFYGRAAGPALLLVAVSALSVGLMLGKGWGGDD